MGTVLRYMTERNSVQDELEKSLQIIHNFHGDNLKLFDFLLKLTELNSLM